MIALAAVLLGAAMWLVIPASPRPRRWEAEPHARSPQREGRRWVVGGAIACAGALVAGAVGGGHRVAVCLGVLVIVGAASSLVVVNRQRQRRARAARRQITDGCAALASLVASGQVSAQALRDVAADWPVLRDGAVLAELGGDPSPSWLRDAARPGHRGLADLGRAWAVAERTGAPLVELLDQVAELLRRDAELRHTVQAELASSRATGRLLAALPLVGLGLGFAFGGDPVHFLLDEPMGWVCLLLGSACAGAGVVWTERIADRAEAW